MSGEVVNIENFARAESNRMLAAILRDSGGINQWMHNREPTPLDHQPVIRQNRDTLYSGSVVDASMGMTVTMPDGGERYMSAMVVNQDHYVIAVLHEPGEHQLRFDQIGTPYVLLAVRTLVDPADPADVAAANALQDQLRVRAESAEPFVLPEYDEASFTATRNPLLELAKGLHGFEHAFGTVDRVDPVRHLIATAAAGGGLPQEEAMYLNVNPGLPVGAYKLTVRDVPVDAFWSISLYNAAGYFEANDRNSNSVNSVTAQPNNDASVTVHFGGCDDNRPNCLPIMEGWNYIVRLYRPRPQLLNGSWSFPSIEPA